MMRYGYVEAKSRTIEVVVVALLKRAYRSVVTERIRWDGKSWIIARCMVMRVEVRGMRARSADNGRSSLAVIVMLVDVSSVSRWYTK